MINQYQLIIRIKTPKGEEVVGQFFLGNVRDIAYETFHQLEGQEITSINPFIYFELIEIEDGLPVNLKIIACNLEEAGRNMKIILKQLFKHSLLQN